MLNPDGHSKTLTAGQGNWRTNTNSVPFPADTPIERWVDTVPYRTAPFKGNTLKFYKLTAPGVGKKETETVPKGVYEGVDINRNYPSPAGPMGSKAPPWGVETFDDDPAKGGGFVEVYDAKGAFVTSLWALTTSKSPLPDPDVFCGPAAGSELETKAVVDLLAKGNFKAVISYHNYSQTILFPDDAAARDDVKFLGEGMKDLMADSAAAYTYQSGSGLYPTSGDTMDWAWRVHTIPNYTIELPPTDADKGKWVAGFDFFMSDTEIAGIFDHNLAAGLAAINCSISGLTPAALAKAKKKKLSVVLDCWKVFLKAKGWTP
jgi:hypothetical protein